MASVVVASCGGDADPPQTAPSQSGPAAARAPTAITHVSPPEGFVGPAPSEISVTFDLDRDGGVDLDSIRLVVDGRDVTDRARPGGTEDIPQSRGALIYEPDPPLADGVHRVEVEYHAGGNTYGHTWDFTVRT